MELTKVKKSIFRNEFRKNILTLFSGTFLGQLIPFILLPVLSRLFSEEQFGAFFLFSSAIALISIIVTLQFELAIVLPEDEKDAVNLFYITIFISLVTSLFLAGIIILFEKYISLLLGNNDLGIWLYFIPLSTFLSGLFQAFTYWFNRNKNFKNISKSKIVKASTAGIIHVSQGLSPLQVFGLIPGLIAGQLLSVLYYLKKYLLEKQNSYGSLSFHNLKVYLSKYYKIPVFNTLLASLNKTSNFLPFLLLGIYYSPAILAFYGLAHRALSTPIGLISQSIGQVFYQRANDIYNNSPKQFFPIIKSIYWRLTKFAFFPYLILFFLASQIFTILYGAKWAVAGLYSAIMVPWLFLLFLNSPVSFIVTILGKQKNIVVYDILLLIGRFLAIYIGYKVYADPYCSILFYSLTGFIFNIFYLIYMIKLAKRV